MEYNIKPFEGVGSIRFGMTADLARKTMNVDWKSFNRTPSDTFPSDYFQSEGVFFYYDHLGLLEAIEFTSPSRPILEGFDILHMTFDRAIEALASLDSQLEREIDSAIAYQLGVSIYAPLAKETHNAPLETVLAFRAGYYN